MSKQTTPTLRQVKEKLSGFDTVGKNRDGNFIVRKEFFYTMGKTTKHYVDIVKKAFPQANIVDSGEVWKPFRGSASVANSSHFYVEFNFNKAG